MCVCFLLPMCVSQERPAHIFTSNQGKCPTDVIKPWNLPLSKECCLSSEMEGWSVLPSGSHHEELADGGCSCSQVGTQAGDWLAFPLDQAHLSGEFTARALHIGSLSDWTANGAKGSHSSPLPFPAYAIFLPHLNLNWAPGCISDVNALEKIGTFESVFNWSLTITCNLCS